MDKQHESARILKKIREICEKHEVDFESVHALEQAGLTLLDCVEEMTEALEEIKSWPFGDNTADMALAKVKKRLEELEI